MESAKNRIVKDIKNDDDRIQITGYLKDVKGSEVILSDNTGEIKIDTTELNNKVTMKQNDLVNIIGNLVITSKGEKILKAQFIQDMSGLRFDYYLKLYELKKELEDQES